LASGFWVAAKLRQIQTIGGYASILVKGHDEAGAVNLILRMRNGTLKHAVPAMASSEASDGRDFEWRDNLPDDRALSALITRELQFDRDQWFMECECTEEQFTEVFNLKLG
jgi:hypothetical protein